MKNLKLAYLFNLFTKHDAEDVIDAGDNYIDLFYRATSEASKEDLQEVIYQLINSKVYDTDWEDIIDELDDNGVIEKIER